MSRQNTQAYEVETPIQRGRPWLYPYNRRLRHLHGISIRNLILSSGRTRARGNTVDDAALPTSLRSPAKVLAQQERKQLEHSRSSTDLKAIAESDAGNGNIAKGKGNEAAGDGSPSKRPAMRNRLRRRSTLDWQNASSQWRQKKLEDVISSNMADVFFSLHVAEHDDPVYISEVVEKTMNPDFMHFDLKSGGPSISRLEDIVIKVWARNTASTTGEYQYLVEMHLNLRSLQFIGKSIEGFPQPLPQNCVLFHMKDGIYTTFLDNFTGEPSVPMAAPPRTMSMPQTLPTSSYDALMRLSTLDECVQDALATRAKLEDEINAILEVNSKAISTVREASFKSTTLAELNDAIATERKRLALARRRRDEAQAQLAKRKELIKAGRASMESGTDDTTLLASQTSAAKDLLTTTTDQTLGQRRRICDDLQKIYPITPIPGKTLHFAIHDLPLSNSAFDNDDTPSGAEATAAALGHVALLVHNLSFYLSTPLPYPITWRGSTSTIYDPLSEVAGGAGKSSRTYPLFGGRGPRFRFEFGVFLLNKDIEVISERVGVRVMDLRQTLPNLTYALYVAAAGKGEVPARKAGGIRGFLRGGQGSGGGSGSGYDSRRESIDSEGSSVVGGSALGNEGKGLMLPPKVPASKALGLALNGAENGKVVGMKKGFGGVHADGKGSKLRNVS